MNGRDVIPAEAADLRALDDYEARQRAELLSELGLEERSVEPSGRVVTVAPQPRAPGGLSPQYFGSENERRDQEAAAVLASLKGKQ